MPILDYLGDSDFLGPGTDIIISLTAVLILLFALNSNLHHQQMKNLKTQQKAQVDHLLNAYKKFGDRLKKIDDFTGPHKKLAAVVDLNQVLYEELAKAKHENAQTLQVLEAFLSYSKSRKTNGLNRSEFAVGNLDLHRVRRNQISIVNEIAKRYGTIPKEKTKNTFVISIGSNRREDIVIRNEITSQTFTFGNHILFDMDKIKLKTEGRQILKNIGYIFKSRLEFIREIQIQGHADPQPSKRYASNLQLAANRAVTVFNLFQFDIGVDPSQHIMSVTSFGQYMPIQRTHYDRDYNHFRLEKDNRTPEKRARNRRIEIVLFYFFQP